MSRVPPHDPAAEQAALSCFLLDGKTFWRAPFREEHFYDGRNRLLFRVVARMAMHQEGIDLVTVVDAVRGEPGAKGIGLHSSYVADVTAADGVYPEHYFRILEDLRQRRLMVMAAQRLEYAAFEHKLDAVDESMEAMSDFTAGIVESSGQDAMSLREVALDHLKTLAAREPGTVDGLSTGFVDVDRFLGGLPIGELTILAAETSVGKSIFALQVAIHNEAKGEHVMICSPEMHRRSQAERAITVSAEVPLAALRSNRLEPHVWARVRRVAATLPEITILDHARMSVRTIQVAAHREAARRPIRLLIVDYLQFLTIGIERGENKTDAIGRATKAIKQLARDLGAAALLLSQLNRDVAKRKDPRPIKQDLRGCLVGQSLVMNADTGARVPIVDIVRRRLRFNVWALDAQWRLVRAPIADAWSAGAMSTYTLRTRTGRRLVASAEHRLLSADGWRRVDQLRPGDVVAVPRRYRYPPASGTVPPARALLLGWLMGDGHLGGSPTLIAGGPDDAAVAVQLGRTLFGLAPVVKPEHRCKTAQRVILTTGRLCGAGKNPLTTWLRGIGVWGQRAPTKRAPAFLFEEPADVIAGFLRGLFHADGTLTRRATTTVVAKLATVSEGLAHDAAALLLRLGILASVRSDPQRGGGLRRGDHCCERIFTVSISDRAQVARFMALVGFLAGKQERAASKLVAVKQNEAGQLDRLPFAVNDYVTRLKCEGSLSWEHLGWRDQGKRMSRERARRIGAALGGDAGLERWAHSDILWDEVKSIEPTGSTVEVYDLSVAGLHNYCVDDIVTHNSGEIEQDADVILFLHRPHQYDSKADPTIVDAIIAKARNGPPGMTTLRWDGARVRFLDMNATPSLWDGAAA